MCYNVNEKILDREKEKEIDWNPLHVYDVKSRKNEWNKGTMKKNSFGNCLGMDYLFNSIDNVFGNWF